MCEMVTSLTLRKENTSHYTYSNVDLNILIKQQQLTSVYQQREMYVLGKFNSLKGLPLKSCGMVTAALTKSECIEEHCRGLESLHK